MASYTTKQGDTLDWICWKHYGRQSGAVEAVLEANPGLAGAGTVLAAGKVIVLPDLPSPGVRDTVKLWD